MVPYFAVINNLNYHRMFKVRYPLPNRTKSSRIVTSSWGQLAPRYVSTCLLRPCQFLMLFQNARALIRKSKDVTITRPWNGSSSSGRPVVGKKATAVVTPAAADGGDSQLVALEEDRSEKWRQQEEPGKSGSPLARPSGGPGRCVLRNDLSSKLVLSTS